MRKFRITLLCLLTAACGQKLSVGTGTNINAGVAYACPSGSNVMTVTTSGSLCGSGPYANQPCAQVTICQPGSVTNPLNCQTISNVLVDTGSYGLRLFKSAIASGTYSSLTQTSAGDIAECTLFGSAKTWGPVLKADVWLTNNLAATVPIQVIDRTYEGGDAQNSVASGICSGSVSSAASAGYNGILGIGLVNQDCGAYCIGGSPEPMYFSCNGSTCSGGSSTTGVSMTLGNQVSNPVPNFVYSTGATALENNGFGFFTAAVNNAGNDYDNGCVVFGVGTQANNIPSSGNVYQATLSQNIPEISVVLSGNTYTGSFIDSGSNGLFLPSNVSLPGCGGWYCPSSLTSFSFTMEKTTIPAAWGPSTSFGIANANSLFNSGNHVFNDLGASIGNTTMVDLGMPFYYGRAVWHGINGQTTGASATGNFAGKTGPFWGY